MNIRPRYPNLPFALLCAAFVAIRVSLLAFSGAPYGDLEELYMGAIAHSALNGLIMPPIEYLYHPHEGGTLLFGVTAAPFFALGGYSWFTLRLCSVAYAAFTFILWCAYATRFHSRRAGLFTALFLCFAPPGFIRLSVLSWGTMVQTPLFDIAILYSFCAFLTPLSHAPPAGTCPRPRISRDGWICLFGFSAGLALFFSYFSSFMILSCFAVWFSARQQLLRWRYALLFALSFTVGFSPWIAVNISTRGAGVASFVDIMTAPAGPSTSVARSAALFGFLLFLSTYWFAQQIPRSFASAYRFFFAAVGIPALARLFWISRGALRGFLLGLLPRGSRTPDDPSTLIRAPLALYLIVVPVVLILTHFEKRSAGDLGYFVNYRYLMLCYPALLFSVALLTCRLCGAARPAPRLAGTAVACLIPLFSLHSSAAQVRNGTFGVGLRLKGYTYYLVGWRVAQKPAYWKDPSIGAGLARALSDPRDRADYLDGFTEIHWWEAIEGDEACNSMGDLKPSERAATDAAMIRTRNAILAADESLRPLFYKSLGRVLCLRYYSEKPRMVERGFELARIGTADTRPPRYDRLTRRDLLPLVYEGMGQTAGSLEACGRNDTTRLREMIPRRYRSYFDRGVAEGRDAPYIQVAQSLTLNPKPPAAAPPR